MSLFFLFASTIPKDLRQNVLSLQEVPAIFVTFSAWAPRIVTGRHPKMTWFPQ